MPRCLCTTCAQAGVAMPCQSLHHSRGGGGALGPDMCRGHQTGQMCSSRLPATVRPGPPGLADLSCAAQAGRVHERAGGAPARRPRPPGCRGRGARPALDVPDPRVRGHRSAAAGAAASALFAQAVLHLHAGGGRHTLPACSPGLELLLLLMPPVAAGDLRARRADVGPDCPSSRRAPQQQRRPQRGWAGKCRTAAWRCQLMCERCAWHGCS